MSVTYGLYLLLASILVTFSLVPGPVQPAVDRLSGRWDAIVTVNGVEVPFPFEIDVDGASATGTFFNGDRRIPSTGGRFANGVLTLSFDQYATSLEASLTGGQLIGEYRRARGGHAFRATPARARPRSAIGDVPSIAGTWIVRARGSKGEAAWRFVVAQKNDDISATILRVDGDTGTLAGGYRDGRFVLSHFSGVRPLLLEVEPKPDGTLTLRQNRRTELVAVREGTARANDIGAPTDPAAHTTFKDAAEPFHFAFPDLDGRIVTDRDPRLAGKVLLINISGSWCPNCHDEAPFLVSLYRAYRQRGLEIVTLSFEEPDQLANPTRLRAFIRAYGIEHTVLVAGNPDELQAKIPQAVNLNAFPTTFIIGRDGRVRATHAGFPSPASGEFYRKAESTVRAEVERLLAER
ncbi:MAG TPA: TlpA disulfide reductase family protein [Vicinamibacterales bacterium]|nr:TlpA disulfide reductase family protein [Vicinamibacterales bacterium]